MNIPVTPSRSITPFEAWWSAGQFCPVDITDPATTTKNKKVPPPLPFRTKAEEDLAKKEDDFSCVCLNHPVFLEFSADILYQIIEKAVVEPNCLTEEELIKIMKPIRDKNDKSIVKKPGVDNAQEFIDLVKAKDKTGFKALANNLHLNMGALYDVTINATYVLANISDDVKQKILKRTQELFCCKDLTYDEIEKFILDSPEKSKNLRYFVDILMYAHGDNNLYRSNLLNIDYIRTKYNMPSVADPRSTGSCHADIVKPGEKILTGNSWYQVNDNSLYALIMKKYKRPYLAGPSGSTMLLYNLLFNVIGLRKDSHTPAKMLGFIIGDYIPHFHTLTEILLSFSIEIGKDYDISQDPVDWCIDYFKSVDINVSPKPLKPLPTLGKPLPDLSRYRNQSLDEPEVERAQKRKTKTTKRKKKKKNKKKKRSRTRRN